MVEAIETIPTEAMYIVLSLLNTAMCAVGYAENLIILSVVLIILMRLTLLMKSLMQLRYKIIRYVITRCFNYTVINKRN